MSKELFPVIFVGHGSPMNAIEQNAFSDKWAEIGHQLPTPDAILCISAHWETEGTHVTISKRPRTIHDFGGFPKELFDVVYPAPGNPALANEIIELIKNKAVIPDLEWGLDHGSWSILKNMYPEAKIPVLQLSMDYSLSPNAHFELAKELVRLREKKVLILCSGNIIHNLRILDWDKYNEPEYGFDWAIEVNNHLKELIDTNQIEALCNYKKLGKEVQLAIPTPEHYVPMLYALALKKETDTLTYFNDKLIMGALSMTSFIIK